jgi:hypothetical protein
MKKTTFGMRNTDTCLDRVGKEAAVNAIYECETDWAKQTNEPTEERGKEDD